MRVFKVAKIDRYERFIVEHDGIKVAKFARHTDNDDDNAWLYVRAIKEAIRDIAHEKTGDSFAWEGEEMKKLMSEAVESLKV